MPSARATLPASVLPHCGAMAAGGGQRYDYRASANGPSAVPRAKASPKRSVASNAPRVRSFADSGNVLFRAGDPDFQPRILSLGYAYLSTAPIAIAAQPAPKELSERLGGQLAP